MIPVLLICSSPYLTASAQPSDSSAGATASRLTVEEVVDRLVRRNLERAQALLAYQGTVVFLGIVPLK